MEGVLYGAFMNLEKEYDRSDWETMWDVLRVYVDRKLLNVVKAFYRDAWHGDWVLDRDVLCPHGCTIYIRIV